MSRAQVAGQLRRLRRDIHAEARHVTRVSCGHVAGADMVEMVRRGSARGRQRAAARLRAMLPEVFAWRIVERGLLGAFLDVSDRPIIATPTDLGQAQRAVVVAYVLLGTPQAVTVVNLWSLEVADHAVRRMIERDPSGSVRAKIASAHASLLGASAVDPPRIGEEFMVPTAGPGALIAEWVPARLTSSGEELVYARARTWLHDDQILEDQTHRVLVPAATGVPTLYDVGLLVPPPLRDVRNRDDGKRRRA